VVYQSLGKSPGERQRAYRAMFSTHLSGDVAQRIETAPEHNHVLGNDRFRGEIEKMLR
jgi:putative transposase